MEVLQVAVLSALVLERLGAYLLVATVVAALQGAETILTIRRPGPLAAPDREVRYLAYYRGQQVSARQHARVVHVAIGAGHVQLSTLGIEKLASRLVGRHSVRVILGNNDVDLLAVGLAGNPCGQIGDLPFLGLKRFLAVGLLARGRSGPREFPLS